MSNDLAKELESLEKELTNLDYDEPVADEEQVEVDEGKPEEEPEAAETGQEAETGETVEEAQDPDDAIDQGGPEGGEKEEHALTTLPDDKDAFGELAGQKVTAQQIMEAGLLEKLVTWGHQGRYMVQKGQKDLEEAKTEKSEAEKLRLLLEERFKKEDEVAEQKATPQVSEEQFAEQLTNEYLPGLKQVAESGGIEKEFLSDFPKAAVHLEHRFQSGANLLAGLIEEVGSIREFVGMQKKQLEKQTATQTFEGVLDEVGGEAELFAGLKDPQGKVDFIKWVTNDDTGLRIAEKDVKDVTADDVKSAYLYYLHTHPEALAAKEAPVKKDKNTHLAGGGGGKAPSKRSRTDIDEFESFEKELRQVADESYQ